MPGALIAVILLIVYGSLYPWTFHARPGLPNPILLLFASQTGEFNRRFLADIIINIALYVPVGMSGYLAFRRLRPALRFTSPILIGFVLSACIEMTQLYVPGRRCSFVDLADNTLGSALGVLAGAIFEIVGARKWTVRSKTRKVDRSALALLLMWLGALTFPLFPVMWLYVYRQKAHQFFADSLTPGVLLTFASAAASWYVAGRMMKAAGLSRRWVWASIALLPLQFFIITRMPSLGELAGALVGIALTKYRHRIAAWGFLAVLIIRGVAPFHFGPPHVFTMIPFGGLLQTEWQHGIQILLEKTWYLGAGIWILRTTAEPLIAATAWVAAIAAGIEIMQMFIPGRIAEITDPLLAILAGLLIYSLTSPSRQSQLRSVT